MARPRKLSDEEIFEAYYHLNDSPSPKTMREVAHDILKDKVDYSTVSLLARKLSEHGAANDEMWKNYLAWKEGRRQAKGLYDILPDGSIVSDFEEVQNFINKAKAKKLKSMMQSLKDCDALYRFLEYKRPRNWTGADIYKKFAEVDSDHSKYSLLVSYRRVATQLKDDASAPEPGQFKVGKVKRYDLFTEEINAGLAHMERLGKKIAANIIRTQIGIGCREGSIVHANEARGGLLGMMWQKVNQAEKTIDVFEGKVKEGILWKGCPLDNFGWDATVFFKEIRGKVLEFEATGKAYELDSTGERIFNMSYEGLRAVYEDFETTLHALFPNKRFDEVTPHTSRHLHVNLCFERGADLAYIAGDAAAGEALAGVGWTDLTTLQKYYLTLSRSTPIVAATIRALKQASPALARQIIKEEKGRVE